MGQEKKPKSLVPKKLDFVWTGSRRKSVRTLPLSDPSAEWQRPRGGVAPKVLGDVRLEGGDVHQRRLVHLLPGLPGLSDGWGGGGAEGPSLERDRARGCGI